MNAVEDQQEVATEARVLRLGTRRSRLATTQAGLVADWLRARGHRVELVPIVTEGDVSAEPLAQLGGTGVFATAIRKALRENRIDLTVHSLKDLPVAPADGLHIVAVPRREDPRDVLVARDGLTLTQLPAGSVVGSGSPRRAAELAALGLGLQVRSIRGNVDTRIGRVHGGDVDAVVLARAGMARLGRLDEVTETIDPMLMLPAPGQGALAVEIRQDDDELAVALAPLDDADTRAAVTAERAVLAELEAGCSAPLGALAEICETETGEEISLRAFVGSVDGSFELRRSGAGSVSEAAAVGADLARVLLADGAEAAFSHAPPGPEPAPGGLLPSHTPTVTDIHPPAPRSVNQ